MPCGAVLLGKRWAETTQVATEESLLYFPVEAVARQQMMFRFFRGSLLYGSLALVRECGVVSNAYVGAARGNRYECCAMSPRRRGRFFFLCVAPVSPPRRVCHTRLGEGHRFTAPNTGAGVRTWALHLVLLKLGAPLFQIGCILVTLESEPLSNPGLTLSFSPPLREHRCRCG